jgi:hypothetical protein
MSRIRDLRLSSSGSAFWECLLYDTQSPSCEALHRAQIPHLVPEFTMAEINPLQRAHTLSAQASTLIHPQSTSLNLAQALNYYREASDLFHQALERREGDESTKKTLEMLISQHKRLIRDLERRIAGLKKSEVEGARVVVGAGGGVGRVGLGSPRSEGLTLGLGGIGGMTGWVSPAGLGKSSIILLLQIPIKLIFPSITITLNRSPSICPTPKPTIHPTTEVRNYLITLSLLILI